MRGAFEALNSREVARHSLEPPPSGARGRSQVIEEWLPDGGSHVVGHFAVSDPDVEAAMRVLSSLLRIPEALARVVDAGSAPIAEILGRRLVDG